MNIANSKTIELYLVDELVSTARRLWDIPECLRDLDQRQISHVIFKCKDINAAKTFFGRAEKHFQVLRKLDLVGDDSSPPSMQGVQIMIPRDQFLPKFYNELAEDISMTKLAQLVVEQRLVAVAKSFLLAFEGIEDSLVVRFFYDDGTPWGKQMNLDGLFWNYLEFTKALVKPRDARSCHIVTIQDGFRIQIDGREKHLSPRPHRGLLVLALLRNEPQFNVERFMKCYEKNFNGDCAKDTRNILKCLQIKCLPKLEWKNLGGGDRSIVGLYFRVIPQSSEIEAELARFC